MTSLFVLPLVVASFLPGDGVVAEEPDTHHFRSVPNPPQSVRTPGVPDLFTPIPKPDPARSSAVQAPAPRRMHKVPAAAESTGCILVPDSEGKPTLPKFPEGSAGHKLSEKINNNRPTIEPDGDDAGVQFVHCLTTKEADELTRRLAPDHPEHMTAKELDRYIKSAGKRTEELNEALNDKVIPSEVFDKLLMRSEEYMDPQLTREVLRGLIKRRESKPQPGDVFAKEAKPETIRR